MTKQKKRLGLALKKFFIRKFIRFALQKLYKSCVKVCNGARMFQKFYWIEKTHG